MHEERGLDVLGDDFIFVPPEHESTIDSILFFFFFLLPKFVRRHPKLLTILVLGL